MANYEDIWYQSVDGLKLYARDYRGNSAGLDLLCMPGLTRNSADFEPLCEYLYPEYRLVVADLRGRGRSEWDNNPSNYHPGVYVQDMFALIERLTLKMPVLVGTSLGGLMAMIMNALRPGSFSGVILNDIGPVANLAGLERIKRYLGKAFPVASWSDAVANTKRINEVAFPGFTGADWEKMAHRMYGENKQGVPQLLYDPAIALPITENESNAVPPDLWQLYEKLADTPLLVIRGALSDILSAETVTEMQYRKPDLLAIEVPNVGHAPILDELPVIAAIESFLANLSKQ